MLITSPGDLKKLGTILGVWAHPDDEIFSISGIMAAAVQNGQEVICITATRGEKGVQDETRWPAAELAEIRQQELYDAYKLIGIHHHHWLDYKDGECNQVNETEAAGRVAELIKLYQPDTIMTFGPDGLTGHPDHQAVSRWADLAKALSGSQAAVYHIVQTPEQYQAMTETDKQLNVFFNTDKPPLQQTENCDICFSLDADLLAIKRNALAAMHSQTEQLLAVLGDGFGAALGTEALVRVRRD